MGNQVNFRIDAEYIEILKNSNTFNHLTLFSKLILFSDSDKGLQKTSRYSALRANVYFYADTYLCFRRKKTMRGKPTHRC